MAPPRALAVAYILAVAALPTHALVQVTPDMKSFGTAIKGGSCHPGVEITVFEHVVNGTNGVVTQMWHAGTRGDPRMRVYVDDEVSSGQAAVDYLVTLAHGLKEVDIGTYPFQSDNFGHTHNMGRERPPGEPRASNAGNVAASPPHSPRHPSPAAHTRPVS